VLHTTSSAQRMPPSHGGHSPQSNLCSWRAGAPAPLEMTLLFHTETDLNPALFGFNPSGLAKLRSRLEQHGVSEWEKVRATRYGGVASSWGGMAWSTASVDDDSPFTTMEPQAVLPRLWRNEAESVSPNGSDSFCSGKTSHRETLSGTPCTFPPPNLPRKEGGAKTPCFWAMIKKIWKLSTPLITP
jgi:hypothetical protein